MNLQKKVRTTLTTYNVHIKIVAKKMYIHWAVDMANVDRLLLCTDEDFISLEISIARKIYYHLIIFNFA